MTTVQQLVSRTTIAASELLQVLLIVSAIVTNAQDYSSNDSRPSSYTDADPLHDDGEDHFHLECDLYMAKSTIANAGIGIFTSKSISKGDIVGNGDVFIPILDLEWHYEASKIFNNYANNNQYYELYPYVDPFNDYSWGGAVMGVIHEAYPYEDITVYAPGIDAAVNSHPILNNVDKSIPQIPMLLEDYDNDNVIEPHRSKHSGVGSYTPYHNGTTNAIYDIPAGSELFKHYGDEWFTQREYKLGQLPVVRDYQHASKMLDKLLYMTDSSLFDSDMVSNVYSLVMEIRDIWPESRILQALSPSLLTLIPKIMINDEDNNDKKNHHLLRHQQAKRITGIEILRMAHQPFATRSTAWLMKHGTCIDHIIPGQSSSSSSSSTEFSNNIGRGAYAKRFLPKGVTITTSPLIHIPNRTLLDMYDVTTAEEDSSNRNHHATKTGSQLLLNYCWGHVESTLLLCPYGSGVNYINHNNNKTLVNVQIQWSKHGTLSVHDDTWLSKTPLDIIGDGSITTTSTSPHLAFDYVATRDIQQGDELILDYGIEWEKAWQKHDKEWKNRASPHWSTYTSATTLNREAFAKVQQIPLRTFEEQMSSPYPNNVELRCHSLIIDDRPWRFSFAGKRIQWIEDQYPDTGYPCRITKRYEKTSWKRQLENNTTSYTDADTNASSSSSSEEPSLRQKQRVSHKYWYDVKVFIYDEANGETIEDAIELLRNRIPRDAIRFFDQPHTTDIHLQQTFRHELQIPDEILPDAWRNVPKRSQPDSAVSESPILSSLSSIANDNYVESSTNNNDLDGYREL